MKYVLKKGLIYSMCGELAFRVSSSPFISYKLSSLPTPQCCCIVKELDRMLQNRFSLKEAKYARFAHCFPPVNWWVSHLFEVGSVVDVSNASLGEASQVVFALCFHKDNASQVYPHAIDYPRHVLCELDKKKGTLEKMELIMEWFQCSQRE